MEEVQEYMPQKNKKSPSKRSQKYDASFKHWMMQQAPAILPLLVPGVTYERAVNVEVIPSVMRTDKAFQVQYAGRQHILHIEFESSHDGDLPSRLLVYNAMLYRDHKCPVITMVVYPFKVVMAEPPLIVTSGEQEILTFDYKTLPLFDMQAQPYVEQHQICMYPLIPVMQGVHADLMTQVLTELSEFYCNDRKTFSDQFAWMKVFLERNTLIAAEDKSKIEERLFMFEQLWEESPTVQKMRSQYYEQGREQGITKGITQGIEQGITKGIQRTLVDFVQIKFPELTEFAQRQARLCKNPEVLETIARELFTAPDSGTAQQLLQSLSGQ